MVNNVMEKNISKIIRIFVYVLMKKVKLNFFLISYPPNIPTTH